MATHRKELSVLRARMRDSQSLRKFIYLFLRKFIDGLETLRMCEFSANESEVFSVKTLNYCILN